MTEPLDPRQLEALVDDLRRAHHAHTVILYGSQARGDATAESDVDVAAFADVAEVTRDARLWSGRFLDAFVYPAARAAAPDAELLKLAGGRVLLDERGIAAPLLERIDALDRQGPPPLREDEARMRRVWARKTLARVRRGDLEARYRRHQLLYQLLEDHFALRGAWYRGPKEALAVLPRDAPATFAAFERALDPDGSLDALEALVQHVVGGSLGPMAAPGRVSEEILIPAPPERLWPLVTEARHFQVWYAFGGATIELRPGGAMSLRWDEHGEFAAVVESVVAPERFSFRWLPAPGPLVEISLAPDGEGTRVRIVETGPLEDAAQSALAWRNALGLLRDLATRA
jgi:uncharacterized protein YndB with AHSA1/START domain